MRIGTTNLWITELSLPEGKLDTAQLQNEITRYVEDSRRTVTGAHLTHSAKLLLLHWPETRDGYTEPTLTECGAMQAELAAHLHASKQGPYTLANQEVFCMMGLRVGGYTNGRIASLDELSSYKNVLDMQPAHMVSARARSDGTTESYGEPTVLLRGSGEAGETAIYAIGDQLEQHHYGIHRGTGTTDFYETTWATK